MSYKALIMYASMTGNTNRVANVFQNQLEHYGFNVTSVKITPKMNWDEYRDRCYFDDYDLILLGSPIVESNMLSSLADVLRLGPWKKDMPAPYNPEGKMGDLTFRRASLPYMGVMSPNWEQKLGIVFSTFGGSFYGPDEAISTLDSLQLHLTIRGVSTIGRFACGGREMPRPVSKYAECLEHESMGEAHMAVQLYRQDPTLKYFERYTPQELETIKELAETAPEFGFTVPLYDTADGKMPGSMFWHYDLMTKPTERDLLRAELFINDVIEDYFLTLDGAPRKPLSTYVSIS